MQTFLESFRTPQEVYEYCKKKGVKGVPNKCQECVIAELLKAEYPERFDTGQYVNVLGTITRHGKDGNELESHGSPKVIREFARGFDLGDYPDLIKESPNG